MSRIVQYENGFRGVASDAVADILVKKGQAIIITPRPGENPDALLSKESIIVIPKESK